MSRVSWNRQLGLAIGLFTLGSLAYWLEYKHKPQKESAETESKKIFMLKDSPVQTLTLNVDGKVYSFNCTDFAAKLCKPNDISKWQITAPTQAKADDTSVNSLLSTLGNLGSIDTIDLKGETAEKKATLLKEYGLDPQARKTARTITVTTAKGTSTLYLGANHPIGESIFAMRDDSDQQIYLLASYFKTTFDHDLTYWRDKKVFSWGAHEVESFKMENSKGHLTAERRDGQWILHTGKEDLTGDTENIDTLLSSVSNLMAKKFSSEQKSSAEAQAILKGFTPAFTITLQREKGTAKEAPAPITVTFFQPKQKPAKGASLLYASASSLDPLYEIEPYVFDRLDKSAKDLRQAKLFTSMDRFAAKRLEFKGPAMGATPLVLVNHDGKWSIEGDNNTLSQEKISELLDKLSGNRIKDFLTGAAIPTGEDSGTQLTIGDDKTPVKKHLVFWRREGKLYARDLLSSRKEVFLMDQLASDALPWDRNFFKKSEAKNDPKSDTSKK